MLQRSASKHNVSLRFGTLGRNRTTQHPRLLTGGHDFSQGERVQWQLQALSTMQGTVLLLDSTDTMLQCDEDALLARAARLLTNDNQVLIAGEYLTWPRFLRFRGQGIEGHYPSPSGQIAPLKFANTGAILGTPAAITRVCKRKGAER